MTDPRPFWESRAVYVVRSGSHAYGTNLPSSDEDSRGVCIPPAEYLIGLREWEHHITTSPDQTILSLRKFVSLALGTSLGSIRPVVACLPPASPSQRAYRRPSLDLQAPDFSPGWLTTAVHLLRPGSRR